MLMRTDPFRELDRLADQGYGTTARPPAMSMDAWREGDAVQVEFDLPGVDPGPIDLDVEINVVTVKAERGALDGEGGDSKEILAAERPRGVFSR
jgi:HSP20 family protein